MMSLKVIFILKILKTLMNFVHILRIYTIVL